MEKTDVQVVNELWQVNWRSIRAYAYKACQGILAGGKYPQFPPSSELEEIADDGITRAYAAALDQAGKIVAWSDPERQLKRLLGFVRNKCQHAVRDWRKDRLARINPSALAPPMGEQETEVEEMLLSLPAKLRALGELLAMGKTQEECAGELDIAPSTVVKYKKAIGKRLGCSLFCRWVQIAVN